ncbi:hypothetical protein [Parasitella parasitica]|uniref:Uncharacterized protein n=1 Tax=Parasitella parasitica TaxID=35722 RepID=A0A0B7N9Z4_9FUNG|nr:hypothetical protein [Parasitella parasitica]
MRRESIKKSQEEIARLKAYDDEAEQKAKAPELVQYVAVGDDVPNFLDRNGPFSKQLISDYESNLTEKSYGNIIKSRSHNTSITYGYKQLEFLFFCKKVYAGRPAIFRFQVRDTKLLAFLMRDVVECEVRKAGENYNGTANTVDMESFEAAINAENKKLS